MKSGQGQQGGWDTVEDYGEFNGGAGRWGVTRDTTSFRSATRVPQQQHANISTACSTSMSLRLAAHVPKVLLFKLRLTQQVASDVSLLICPDRSIVSPQCPLGSPDFIRFRTALPTFLYTVPVPSMFKTKCSVSTNEQLRTGLRFGHPDDHGAEDEDVGTFVQSRNPLRLAEACAASCIFNSDATQR
jgi:hypothetical protein